MHSKDKMNEITNKDRMACLALAAERGYKYPTVEAQKKFVRACGEFRQATDKNFKAAVDYMNRGGMM